MTDVDHYLGLREPCVAFESLEGYPQGHRLVRRARKAIKATPGPSGVVSLTSVQVT